MYLYLKQKIFSIGDKYNIYNQDGGIVYAGREKLMAFLPQFFLEDTNGNELFSIKKKLTAFLGRYEIYKGETLCATVMQKLSFTKANLSVESQYGSFEVSGDFFAYNFSISRDGTECCRVSKKLLSWGDSYEIYIPNGEEAPFICALVIAIDNCLHNENQ